MSGEDPAGGGAPSKPGDPHPSEPALRPADFSSVPPGDSGLAIPADGASASLPAGLPIEAAAPASEPALESQAGETTPSLPADAPEPSGEVAEGAIWPLPLASEVGTEAVSPSVVDAPEPLIAPPDSEAGTQGEAAQYPEGQPSQIGTEAAAPSLDPISRSGSVSMDPMVGRVLLDRYEVLYRIGAGGMGAVYVAEQVAVGRKVAVKLLRPELLSNDQVRRRFQREAEVVAKLSHPNTIQLFDYGKTRDGFSVMVMELLEGLSLRERLKTRGAMSMIETVRLGQEVAGSLREAHLAGLVHRDLKPANIFLAEVGGEVHGKVLDFGIARVADEEMTRLTVGDQIFGTPRYMAPEQALATSEVDGRADLYGLGLILYECLVGQSPFQAKTSIQYLQAHTSEPPPKLRDKLPEAPEILEQLIDACLQKEPADRPQSAEEIAQVLHRLEIQLEAAERRSELHTQPAEPAIETQPALALRPPLAEAKEPVQEPPKKGRGALVALLLVGLLISGVAAAAVGLWPRIKARLGGDPAPVFLPAARPDAGAPSDAGAILPPTSDAAADAGGADAGGVDDAGVPDASAPPDAGVKKKARPSKRRRKAKPRRSKSHKQRSPKKERPKRGSDEQQGVTQGPRTMTIDAPIDDDESADIIERAARCTSSKFAGVGKLSTRRCPADCAIIVGYTCFGRTPAKDRPLPPGTRSISVVCGKKIVRSRTLQIGESGAAVFRCR